MKLINEAKRMQQLAGLLKEDSALERESSSLNEVEVDMMGKKCKTCGKGVYKETSLMDDMKGVLHCNKCGAETERYIDSTKVDEAIGQDNNYKKAALEVVALAKVLIKPAEEQLSMRKEMSYASRLTDADQLSDLYYHLLDELGNFVPSNMDQFKKGAKEIIVDRYNIEMTDEYGFPMKWR